MHPAYLYFSPHQDDELLTLGLDILRKTRSGAEVHVILCSDGARSRVRQTLSDRETCSFHPGIHEFDPDEQAFIAARDREFTGSCLALGVKAECIHIPETRMTDGTLTAESCAELIRHYLGVYGRDCRVCAILPRGSAGQHPDHHALGSAAKRLFDEGLIGVMSLFSEPYLMSGMADLSAEGFPASETMHADLSEKEQLRRAMEAYFLWDPARGRYAVGAHSMEKSLYEMAADGVFYSCSFGRKNGERSGADPRSAG